MVRRNGGRVLAGIRASDRPGVAIDHDDAGAVGARPDAPDDLAVAIPNSDHPGAVLAHNRLAHAAAINLLVVCLVAFTADAIAVVVRREDGEGHADVEAER